jgi:hypothetical protein
MASAQPLNNIKTNYSASLCRKKPVSLKVCCLAAHTAPIPSLRNVSHNARSTLTKILFVRLQGQTIVEALDEKEASIPRHVA